MVQNRLVNFFLAFLPTVQQDPEDCSSEGADNCPLGESGVAGVDRMLTLSGIHVTKIPYTIDLILY